MMNTVEPQVRGGSDQVDIRFLVDRNADGIIVVDDAGIVLFANPAAEHIFGRSSDALIGSPIGIPLTAGDTTEITIHQPGGDQVEAEIRIVDTRWDHRPARLASLRDISARKAMEERLRHSAKMEAVGQLTAGIAHDFNNLLTVVLGNLESVRRQSTVTDAAQARALDNATRAARRAAMLTERLLAFARRKPLEPRVLDINEIVLGMSDLLQRTLGERIRVRTVLDSQPWKIEADPTELEAALLNLAVNARDAMPAGGTLMIETANVTLDPAYADMHQVKAGPYVLVSIADSGVGMSADMLKRVFEPFFTTKADGRGTGLGLSQVYGFVKQSGGHVKLYSEPNIGTTAKMYFPRVAEPAGTSQPKIGEPKSAEEIPAARPGEMILVVEDDEDVRNYTVGSLRELGYVVFEAADAASALSIIEAQPSIHVLFTDLGLPGGIDGRALAERARRMRRNLQVLITTAYAGSALVHEGRLDPGIELLGKPFSFDALATRIRAVLDRGRRQDHDDTHILVVDDEVLLRMLVVDILEARGWRVEEAGNFREAAAKIERMSDRLDAAVIDLGLPDRSGVELVDVIRAVRPRLPIVLATGYAADDLRSRLAQDKHLQIVGKPFDPELLVGALKRLGLTRVA
jgi:signal transduction histidine kinase/CheY-like chemotaxis protein